MASADERIRVSDAVKKELDRRRRKDESYNTVLQWVPDEGRALLAGFGRGPDGHADRVREGPPPV